MSHKQEGIHGRNPEAGRGYYIDYLNAVEGVQDFLERNKLLEEDPVISGFHDYLYNNSKTNLNLLFDQIEFNPHKNTSMHDTSRTFGVIHAEVAKPPLEIVNNQAEIIADTKKTVANISIPIVNFSTDTPNTAVTPEMLRKSFRLFAEFLRDAPDQGHLPTMVLGLTHPRMGQLSRRWGFQVSEQPFLPPVYEFIDKVAADLQSYPENVADLQKVGRQVMVYQPTNLFVASYAKPMRGF